jgi:succinate dehydrogenase/fumarate reductase iron-sulfur protein
MTEEFGIAKIYRFDPRKDKAPVFETFKVPYKGMRILDTLHYVCEHYDANIAFRESCRTGLCDVCRCVVNGKPLLTCMSAAEKEMIIEVPSGLPVIRDLVVDEPDQRNKFLLARGNASSKLREAYVKSAEGRRWIIISKESRSPK